MLRLLEGDPQQEPEETAVSRAWYQLHPDCTRRLRLLEVPPDVPGWNIEVLEHNSWSVSYNIDEFTLVSTTVTLIEDKETMLRNQQDIDESELDLVMLHEPDITIAICMISEVPSGFRESVLTTIEIFDRDVYDSPEEDPLLAEVLYETNVVEVCELSGAVEPERVGMYRLLDVLHYIEASLYGPAIENTQAS